MAAPEGKSSGVAIVQSGVIPFNPKMRRLFMDMYIKNDMGWAKENDIYSGPYISLRAKFSSTEKWTYVKKKTEKKVKINRIFRV